MLLDKYNSLPRDEHFTEATSDVHVAILAGLYHLDIPQVSNRIAALVDRLIGEFDGSLYSILKEYNNDLSARSTQMAHILKDWPESKALRRLGKELTNKEQEGSIFSLGKWADLCRPFRYDEIELTNIRVDSQAGTGSARPIICFDALIRRLDESAGRSEWSVHFDWVDKDHIKASLNVLGATREGFGTGVDPMSACSEAIRQAARLFGIADGLHGEAKVLLVVDDHGHIMNREDIHQQLVDRMILAG